MITQEDIEHHKSCKNQLEGECGIHGLKMSRLFGAKFQQMEKSFMC